MKRRDVFKGDRGVAINIVPDAGLNVGMDPGNIGDRQASALLNMWYAAGRLRLRPGTVSLSQIGEEYGRVLDVYPRDGAKLLIKRISRAGDVIAEKYGIYIATQKAVFAFDGESFERIPSYARYEGGTWKNYYTDLQLSGCFFLPSRGVELFETDGLSEWRAEGDAVFLFGGGGVYLVTPQVLSWTFPLGQIHITADAYIVPRKPYIPTLFTGCAPSGGGRACEARNLLTPKVAQSFTADSLSCEYKLCDSGLDDDAVTVSYHNPGTGEDIEIVFDPGESTQTVSWLTVRLDRKAGTVTFSQPLAGGAADNVKVAYSKSLGDEPVLKCTAGVWFGSGNNGTGSRIFLGGCQGAPNRVYHTQREDPTYFPSDGVITVGDPSDPVTALIVQFDELLVLKRRSVYAVAGHASRDYYSVRQVHMGDGCDMPGSVQLARNAVIWANSEGGMFMLYSTQLKDERAVRTISAAVNPLLLSNDKEALEQACSVCDREYYYLFVGNQAFLWHFGAADISAATARADYGSFAFYHWRLPFAPGRPFILNQALHAFEGQAGALHAFDQNAAHDDGRWFEAWMDTKDFNPFAGLVAVQSLSLVMDCTGAAVDIGCGELPGELPVPMPLPLCPGEKTRLRVHAARGPRRGVAVRIKRHESDLFPLELESISLELMPGPGVR